MCGRVDLPRSNKGKFIHECTGKHDSSSKTVLLFFLSTLRSTVADYHVLCQFVLVRCITHQSLNEQRTIVNLMTDEQCSEATQDEE